MILLNTDDLKQIKQLNNSFDRIIYNNFEFMYDAKHKRLVFESFTDRKQDNNSLIGFKFVGKQEIYYYNLRNMSIPDYVKCLCQRYKDLISTGIIERELKPFVKSIEISLNYTDLVF